MGLLMFAATLPLQAKTPDDPLRVHGISVIPTPQEVHIESGEQLQLSMQIPVSGDPQLANTVLSALSEQLETATPQKQGGVTVSKPRQPSDALWTHDQAYQLTITAKVVTIEAKTSRAAFYAATTLSQIIKHNKVIPPLIIRDWPAIPNRLVMIATDQGGFQVIDIDYWKRIIRELSALKISAVMPYFDAGTFKYRKHPYLSTKGDDGFTVEKAKLLSEYAKQHFIELIPQQNSLGHLGGALGHKEIQHLRDGGGTINMVIPETLTFLGELYDDLVEGFPYATAIHVGGDEFGHGFGHNPAVAARINEIGAPAVYAQFMSKLHEMLRKRNRGMMIWWHEKGFTIKAADIMPKDIAVFDWHYGPQKAYPSLDNLIKNGFANPWATPAVTRFYNGTDDWERTFVNIGGFARAGAKSKVPGMCTCTWVHGMWGGRNMFELNLYGLAYSAESSWNPERNIAINEFATTYAAHWFGVRSPDADALIIQAIHTPYGEPEKQGFWRNNRALEPICGSPLTTITELNSDAAALTREAQSLLALCDRADDAVEKLRANATRNSITLDYLRHDIRIHRLAANRVLTAQKLTRWCDSLRPKENDAMQRVLSTNFTTEKPLPPLIKIGAGAKIIKGLLITEPLAEWRRDGLTVGPIPMADNGVQIEYDLRPMRQGKQFQQFASRAPSTHHYMIFIGSDRTFHVYTRNKASWGPHGTTGTRCELGKWYHCKVRIRDNSLSFKATERDTGKVVCRSGMIPMDDPGDIITFDLTDNHEDAAAPPATEWDNLIISELALLSDVIALPPSGLRDSLKSLIADHRTIEVAFEHSIHEAGGGSIATGSIGNGGVRFRSRQGREEIQAIIEDLKENRLPRCFAE